MVGADGGGTAEGGAGSGVNGEGEGPVWGLCPWAEGAALAAPAVAGGVVAVATGAGSGAGVGAPLVGVVGCVAGADAGGGAVVVLEAVGGVEELLDVPVSAGGGVLVPVG